MRAAAWPRVGNNAHRGQRPAFNGAVGGAARTCLTPTPALLYFRRRRLAVQVASTPARDAAANSAAAVDSAAAAAAAAAKPAAKPAAPPVPVASPSASVNSSFAEDSSTSSSSNGSTGSELSPGQLAVQETAAALEDAVGLSAEAAAVAAVSAANAVPDDALLVLSPPPAALQLQAAIAELAELQAAPGAADEGATAAAAAAAAEAAAELAEQPPPVPTDVLLEFEQKLEADVASVFLTLAAVTGVIVFWRGVWSLLDYFLGESLLGDVSCIFAGLTIVLWIRLSGAKVATSFWPPG